MTTKYRNGGPRRDSLLSGRVGALLRTAEENRVIDEKDVLLRQH